MNDNYKRDIWHVMIAYGGVIAPEPEEHDWRYERFVDFYSTTVNADYDLSLQAWEKITQYGFIADASDDPMPAQADTFADTDSPPDQVYYLAGNLYLGNGERITFATRTSERMSFPDMLQVTLNAPTEQEALALLKKRLDDSIGLCQSRGYDERSAKSHFPYTCNIKFSIIGKKEKKL